ncbi:MAG: asparagine synthase-related protein [Thermoguttaceae bacterium]
MSLFAGIYSLTDTGPPPDQASIDIITRTISRAGDPVTTFSDRRFFLAKIDVCAFPETAFIGGGPSNIAGNVATIAGHPFVAESRARSTSRQVHLEVICSELDQGRFEVLRDCYGPFALCYRRLPRGPLILSTDRVGTRPLYYHIGENYLFFSNALRLLEALPQVPKRMDAQAFAENVAIGFPLADRTLYADIKVLENGQYLLCEDGAVRLGCYFQWDQIGPTNLTEQELLDRAYETFLSAVARRSEDQSKVVSNLSGGLDSRCIVTALHALRKETLVLTWATDGYLDARLAREYAKALGLKQVFGPIPAVPSWSDLLRCLHDLKCGAADAAQLPNLVFSGDGGSVGVGYDYLNAERIGWLRTGQVEKYLDFFVARHALPRNFITDSAYRTLNDALYEGVKSELKRIHSADPGRDLHTFYMKNDQRRHLYPLYENIDTCRVEYLLPFYDGQFLELLTSAEVDLFLRHNFYHQWLTRFPPIIMSVAWQTYPDHLPCPVKTEVSGRNQWDKRRRDWFSGKNREAFRRCARALVQRDFPFSLLNRRRLFAAWVLHGLRIQSYGHVLDVCALCQEYYSKCQGDVVFRE